MLKKLFQFKTILASVVAALAIIIVFTIVISPENTELEEEIADNEPNELQEIEIHQLQEILTELEGIPEVGDNIPNFSFVDSEGEENTLEDYRGKAVYLYLWTSMCPPCIEKLPDIQKMYENFKDEDVEILTLNIDFMSDFDDQKEGVINFMEDNGYTFPVVLDAAQLFNIFNFISYPANVFINPEGEITEIQAYALPREVIASSIIEALESVEND